MKKYYYSTWCITEKCPIHTTPESRNSDSPLVTNFGTNNTFRYGSPALCRIQKHGLYTFRTINLADFSTVLCATFYWKQLGIQEDWSKDFTLMEWHIWISLNLRSCICCLADAHVHIPIFLAWGVSRCQHLAHAQKGY